MARPMATWPAGARFPQATPEVRDSRRLTPRHLTSLSDNENSSLNPWNLTMKRLTSYSLLSLALMTTTVAPAGR